MINECEDKLICDLAETYHILNYRELSPDLVATLLIGLGDGSRVKKHYSKNRLTIEQALLAMIADRLNFIAWTKTKDAQKGGKYKLKSIYEALNKEPEKEEKYEAFDTVEAYEEYIKTKREG